LARPPAPAAHRPLDPEERCCGTRQRHAVHRVIVGPATAAVENLPTGPYALSISAFAGVTGEYLSTESDGIAPHPGPLPAGGERESCGNRPSKARDDFFVLAAAFPLPACGERARVRGRPNKNVTG